MSTTLQSNLSKTVADTSCSEALMSNQIGVVKIPGVGTYLQVGVSDRHPSQPQHVFGIFLEKNSSFQNILKSLNPNELLDFATDLRKSLDAAGISFQTPVGSTLAQDTEIMYRLIHEQPDFFKALSSGPDEKTYINSAQDLAFRKFTGMPGIDPIFNFEHQVKKIQNYITEITNEKAKEYTQIAERAEPNPEKLKGVLKDINDFAFKIKDNVLNLTSDILRKGPSGNPDAEKELLTALKEAVSKDKTKNGQEMLKVYDEMFSQKPKQENKLRNN